MDDESFARLQKSIEQAIKINRTLTKIERTLLKIERPLMKLEAGKYYKTRNGLKAYVEFIRQDNPFRDYIPEYPAIGFIESYGEHMWKTNGEFNTFIESELDLISEWREPVKVSGWVNVYDTFTSMLYKTKERANSVKCQGRIACIYVSGVEK